MVTIRTIEHIKTGAKINMWNGIYAVLLGFFYLIFSDFILKINFRALGDSWGFFDKFNPDLSALFGRLFILVGLIIVAVGAGLIYLSHTVAKKKEKDLWIVLFIIGIIFWSGLLTIEILNKNYYTIAMSFFGWITFVVGMFIPIRYYLEKPYDSY